MSDAFKPEADRLEQEQEVAAGTVPEDDTSRPAEPSLRYPAGHKLEVPDADLLEQSQPVDDDDDYR